MRRHGREQHQARRRHHGARQRGHGARGAVAEALVEQGDAHRRGHRRIDDGHGGQRRGQPGTPVGGLREQQPAGRQYGDRRQVRPQPGRHARLEVLRDRLREHGGHPEGRTGGRRQQHAAQHGPVRPPGRQEQHRRPARRHRQQQDPFRAGQGLPARAVPAGQGEEPGQAGGGQDGPAPGRRARPASHEEGGHREGEDDGQRTQRLDEAQRPVRERQYVQRGAESVQGDRRPPAGPAQRCVGAVRRARRDVLLDDRTARVRDGGDQAEEDRQGQGAHAFHDAAPGAALHPPTGSLIGERVILLAYTGRSTYRFRAGVRRELPRHAAVVHGARHPRRPVGGGRVAERTERCEPIHTVTGGSRSVRRTDTGLVPGVSAPYSGGFGTSAAGGRGRANRERQRP